MDLKEVDISGERIRDHWYYFAKGRAMRAFLGDITAPSVLDIGAGSGIFSRQLLDEGVCQAAICLDSNYPEEHSEQHNNKPIRFVKSIDNTPQQLILMMDVLEHVPNDSAFLEQYTEALDSGGHALITVPAFQFLWSGHDIFLEHYRRYTLNSVEDAARKAGLKPVKSRYFFGTLFPIVATIRLLKNISLLHHDVEAKSELKLYPDWLNSTLISLHDMERRIFFSQNRFYGLSLFCLCKKP